MGARALFFVEYGRWIPAQNDPGDFFAFVPNDVVVVALRLCLDDGCE